MAFVSHPHPVSLRLAGEPASRRSAPHASRARAAAALRAPPARGRGLRGSAGAATAV